MKRVHNSLVRISGSHAKEQVFRFLRLFVLALLPQLVAFDFNNLTRSALIALIVPAVEVSLREYKQTVPTNDVVPIPVPQVGD